MEFFFEDLQYFVLLGFIIGHYYDLRPKEGPFLDWFRRNIKAPPVEEVATSPISPLP